MTNKFRYYKEKHILVRRCKAPECPASYRPERGSQHDRMGLCWKHRRIWYRNWYLNWFLPWFKKQPPEIQVHYRQMKYNVWLKWVEKNINRRRKSALTSYHKQKAGRQEKRNAKRRDFYARKGR